MSHSGFCGQRVKSGREDGIKELHLEPEVWVCIGMFQETMIDEIAL